MGPRRYRLLVITGCVGVLVGTSCVGGASDTGGHANASLASAPILKLAGFPGTAAGDANGLWVANYTAGTIVRVDGVASLRQTSFKIGNPTALSPGCATENESLPIGSWLHLLCHLPRGVAVGAGSVWVGRNDLQVIERLDPATGRTIATIPVAMNVFNIAASSSAVWATSFQDNLIARIDPQTNAVTLRQTLQGAPAGVLIASGSVWISTSGDAKVVRLDAETGASQASIDVGVQPLPLAAAPGAIWVRCEQDNTVVRIDPSTNRVVATIPVGVFFGQDGLDNLVANQAGVWANGLNLQWIDASTNRVTRTLPIEGRPYDAGGGALWILSLEGRVSRIAP